MMTKLEPSAGQDLMGIYSFMLLCFSTIFILNSTFDKEISHTLMNFKNDLWMLSWIEDLILFHLVR